MGMAFTDGMTAYDRGDYARAAQVWHSLAERGDTRAPAVWYQKAAAQGHGKAQYNLGIIYLEGHGFSPDFDAAASWFRKAAAQGVAGADRKAEEASQRARQREQRRQEQARRAEQTTRDNYDQAWWVVLGTDAETSMEIAKQAYRAKMKQYHPDRTLGLAPELIQMAETKARELNSAMEQAERHHRFRAQHHSRASL